jgi:hypothetical protein
MAKYISIRQGTSAHPEQSVAHLTHDLIYQTGVVDLTSDWKVTEHNPQNLSVDIAQGRGFFKKQVMTYHGYSDTIENIAINANNSGNPRIDAVVLYVDLSATPNSDASNVLKSIVVQGTPASSPVAPTDNEIQTAIGSGNPFLRLANVYVASGASAITNANITDTRLAAYLKTPGGIKDQKIINPTTKGGKQEVYEASGSGSITLDFGSYNVFKITLTGNATLSFTNAEVGQFRKIDLIQDGTGSRNVTWPTGIRWPDGVTPVLTPTANKTDSFVIEVTGTNQYNGYIVGQNL